MGGCIISPRWITDVTWRKSVFSSYVALQHTEQPSVDMPAFEPVQNSEAGTHRGVIFTSCTRASGSATMRPRAASRHVKGTREKLLASFGYTIHGWQICGHAIYNEQRVLKSLRSAEKIGTPKWSLVWFLCFVVALRIRCKYFKRCLCTFVCDLKFHQQGGNIYAIWCQFIMLLLNE